MGSATTNRCAFHLLPLHGLPLTPPSFPPQHPHSAFGPSINPIPYLNPSSSSPPPRLTPGGSSGGSASSVAWRSSFASIGEIGQGATHFLPTKLTTFRSSLRFPHLRFRYWRFYSSSSSPHRNHGFQAHLRFDIEVGQRCSNSQ